MKCGESEKIFEEILAESFEIIVKVKKIPIFLRSLVTEFENFQKSLKYLLPPKIHALYPQGERNTPPGRESLSPESVDCSFIL